MIRHNWKYKLLALMVALILWTYVNAERNPQSRRTFTVPVSVVEVAKGHVAKLDSEKISVTIAGLKTAVDAVAKEDVEAFVNLSSLPRDKEVVEASLPVHIRLPRAIAADLDISASPKRLQARMEALGQRRIQITASFIADPPPGFSYGTPIVNPESVMVSGRVTQLSKISKATITVSGDLASSPNGDYCEVVPLDSSGNIVEEVSVRPQRARVKLGMIEMPATKTVIVSPVFSGVPKFPARVQKYTVTPSSVTLEGKPSRLSSISAISTETVSLEGAESTVIRDISLEVPYGTKPIGSRTVRITVFITPGHLPTDQRDRTGD